MAWSSAAGPGIIVLAATAAPTVIEPARTAPELQATTTTNTISIMTTFKFEGYSDNIFSVSSNYYSDEYNNLASGEPIEFIVQDSVTGLAIIVTGQYCPDKSTGWLIGVSNGNDKAPFPSWPIRIEPQDEPYRNEIRIVIEAPFNACVRCLTREQLGAIAGHALESATKGNRPTLKSSPFYNEDGECWCFQSADGEWDVPASWHLRVPCHTDEYFLPHYHFPVPGNHSPDATKMAGEMERSEGQS